MWRGLNIKIYSFFQWDLVCKKDYYSDLSQTIYQVGALIGELLCSVLVDKFGRRKTYLVGTLIIIVLGTTAAFSPNYIFFCIVRTIMAAAVLVSRFNPLLGGVLWG